MNLKDNNNLHQRSLNQQLAIINMVLEKLCLPTFFETFGWKRIFGIQEMVFNFINLSFIISIPIPVKQVFKAFGEKIDNYKLLFTECENFEEHLGACNCLLVQLQWTNKDGSLDRGRHIVVLTASNISETGKLVFSAIDSSPNSENGESSGQNENQIKITAKRSIGNKMLYSVPYPRSEEYAFLEKGLKLYFTQV